MKNQTPEDETPDWLKQGASSTGSDWKSRIKKWLLRPPTPSKTAWFMFLMGAMCLGIWLYQRVIYAIENSMPFPFHFGGAGGLSVSLYLVCFYGAELLPQQSRGLIAFLRVIGVCAAIIFGIFVVRDLWAGRFL